MFCGTLSISLSVSLNEKPVTLQENDYNYNAYLEKLPNYGTDASATYLVTNFWYLDTVTAVGSLTADLSNEGHRKRL
jgi:hypothetical protein